MLASVRFSSSVSFITHGVDEPLCWRPRTGRRYWGGRGGVYWGGRGGHALTTAASRGWCVGGGGRQGGRLGVGVGGAEPAVDMQEVRVALRQGTVLLEMYKICRKRVQEVRVALRQGTILYVLGDIFLYFYDMQEVRVALRQGKVLLEMYKICRKRVQEVRVALHQGTILYVLGTHFYIYMKCRKSE